MNDTPSIFVPPPRDPFKIARVRQWDISSAVGTHGSVRDEVLELQRRHRGWTGRTIVGYRLPDFQRPYAWSRAQQIAFCESVWAGYDIGRYVLNVQETYDAIGVGPLDNMLVDGQQRLGAIEAYMADAFPVYGALWSQVPALERRRGFLDRPFPCIESGIDDEAELERVYRRLAYGGTPHQAARTVPALENARAALGARPDLVAEIDAALAEWKEAA